MESFMGQLILNDEINYEAAKEHIEERVRVFTNRYVYNVAQRSTDNLMNGRKKIYRRN